MKRNQWLGLLAFLLVVFLLNGCGGDATPDSGDAPAATVPPSSIGSEGSHVVRPTPANPEEKVEPTRAISAETVAQADTAGPQSNNSNQDEPVHRNGRRIYLLVVIRR